VISLPNTIGADKLLMFVGTAGQKNRVSLQFFQEGQPYSILQGQPKDSLEDAVISFFAE
jgi:hypothetical protein